MSQGNRKRVRIRSKDHFDYVYKDCRDWTRANYKLEHVNKDPFGEMTFLEMMDSWSNRTLYRIVDERFPAWYVYEEDFEDLFQIDTMFDTILEGI